MCAECVYSRAKRRIEQTPIPRRAERCHRACFHGANPICMAARCRIGMRAARIQLATV